ncbi:MAG: hypothetical protein JW969_03895 [Spirochaetales bacterium]|nr:hypothetical protein [Spirochaetales bacterium]
MRISSFQLNNPLLQYSLDPGEPGLAYPAKASDSIARVATHELGNIRRFKREANEQGGIVVSERIYLNLEYAGSFLAATSGYSEAHIIYPHGKDSGISGENSDKNAAPSVSTRPSDEVTASHTENNDNKINADSNGQDGNESREIDKLKDEERDLAAEYAKITEEKRGADDPDQQKIDREEQRTKAELNRIKARINYLEQKELLSKYADQVVLALKITGTRFGAAPDNNKTAHSIDIFA